MAPLPEDPAANHPITTPNSQAVILEFTFFLFMIFGICVLELVWDLGFGTWDFVSWSFSGVWSLVLGAWCRRLSNCPGRPVPPANSTPGTPPHRVARGE